MSHKKEEFIIKNESWFNVYFESLLKWPSYGEIREQKEYCARICSQKSWTHCILEKLGIEGFKIGMT